MSRSKSSPQETLTQIGIVDDLPVVWESLGFTSHPRPSSSKSSLLEKLPDSKELKLADHPPSPREVSDDDATSTDESEQQRKLWTKHLLIDITCDGKFLVLASQKEIVILTAKWKNERLVFSKFWNGMIADEDSSEGLVCCLALPLKSRRRTSDGLPDWTCVVYGFKSGFVAFHTETGHPVHRQQFELLSVVGIKLQSSSSLGGTREGIREQDSQELVVLYENGVVVVISGLDLYTSLQTFKHQAADAISKGHREDGDLETNSIPHEKYQFDRHQTISDVISLGSSRISGFDQLLNASLLGGRTATVKPPLPTFRRFIAVGSSPLYSSYHIMEGENALVIGQVAKAMASKVTSALTSRFTATATRFGLQGFLNRSSPTREVDRKTKTLPKASKSVEARYNIYDSRRVSEAITLSGSGRLAAMTDNFGRVLLMDCATGVIVKMWKGYRSAEVAWMTLVDPKSEQKDRFVECLIIYAPRRHLLEVWTAQSGRRLVAVRVNQGLRLLRVGTVVLGHQSCSDADAVCNCQCYFLDLAGQLFALNIPFYVVEEGVDENNAQDMQVLQELKDLIASGRKGRGRNEDEIEQLVASIGSCEVKEQAVNFLLTHKNNIVTPVIVCEILSKEMEELKKISQTDLTETIRLTKRSWEEQLAILKWFQSIDENWRAEVAETPPVDGVDLGDELYSGNLFAVLDNVMSARRKTPEIGGEVVEWRRFLDCFERTPGTIALEDVQFGISEELEEQERLKLACYLIMPYFQWRVSLDRLLGTLRVLDPSDVIQLLVSLWLHPGFRATGGSRTHVELLGSMLRRLLHDQSLGDMHDYYTLLRDSANIPAALTACITILSACAPLPPSDASPDSSEEWESVCKEKLEWARLSQRMESLLSLQAFLVRFLFSDKHIEESVEVSVQDALHRGPSAAAEYLAAWGTRGFLELPPAAIMKAFYSADIEVMLPSRESEDQDDRPLRFLHVQDISLENKEVSEALVVLKAIFPKSLTADALLANCCWEFAVLWNKNPEEAAMLEMSLLYLRDIVHGKVAHGVALMIWKMFVREKVSACASLMEKVGKAPKQRLFERDVNMSESAVLEFFALAHRLLIHVIDADVGGRVIFKLEVDDLWYNETTSGKSSVVDLAVEQPASTVPVVKHHMILLTILHAIMFFNLKSTRPLSLFDFKAREAFFNDLHMHPVLSILDLDQSIIKSRTQFLTRSLAALVRLAAEHCTQPDVVWFERILEVGEYWSISGDEVRSLYVCELYSHGLDELGEEAYRTVTDKQPLLAQLMILAGERIASLINNTQSRSAYANSLSSMSPTLGSWIKSMDPSALANKEVDWERCYLLIRNISHDLGKQQAQHKLCSEIIEWIQTCILTR